MAPSPTRAAPGRTVGCTLVFALAALLFTACGGGASPTTAPAAGGGATQAPVAAASPAGAPSAAASQAPAGGDTNPACALLTANEAATVLGGPVTETKSIQSDTEVAECAFYAGTYPDYTGQFVITLEYPPGAKSRFDVSKVSAPGVKAVSGLGDEAWSQNIGGTGQAHVVAIQGDSVVGILLNVPHPPNTVPSPIPDASLTVLQELVAKALTRI